jgi:membrane protein YdbS with pleckstrin-like domain
VAINPKLLNPGEQVVISTRTHPKAIFWPVLLLVVLVAAGIAFMVVVDNGTARIVVWVVLLVAALWWVAGPVLRWLSSSYTVTNRRLITRSGIVTRKGHDIPLSRISDVEYEFGLLDRMLGCGTLKISDASTDGEVTLHDIPHVEESQRRLNELLQRLHEGESRSSEGA